MTGRRDAPLIERLMPLALTLGVIIIATLTLYPFLPAVLWAAMVAIAIEPSYVRLVKWLNGRRVLAAWLMGVGLMLAIIIPAIGLGRTLLALVPDALNWLERLAYYTTAHVGPGSMQDVPSIAGPLSKMWTELHTDVTGFATHYREELKTVLLWIFGQSQVFGVFVFEFAIGIILAMILVMRAGRVTELASKFFEKVGGRFALRLAAHSVETTRLAVRGVLGAALAQTLVATFSYVVAGVPGWVLWAGITFVLSLIQVGPVLIWVPMSLWLWTQDQSYMAAFVFLWGLVVVNLTDNIVRPMLVSKGSDLPASLAFLGAVGGLMQWGVVGVFLGPVIVAVGYELVLKWLEPETLPEETLEDMEASET
jgi:predicted PurR-regulated permease PerM